jgi:hypothetical protein
LLHILKVSVLATENIQCPIDKGLREEQKFMMLVDRVLSRNSGMKEKVTLDLRMQYNKKLHNF